MVIPPFFCFEGTVYDVTNLACGVAHFQAECLAHYSPVRVAHIAPESLAHFTPVEVAHYAPVCSPKKVKDSFFPLKFCMKMRRIVLVIKHLDDDSEKS